MLRSLTSSIFTFSFVGYFKCASFLLSPYFFSFYSHLSFHTFLCFFTMCWVLIHFNLCFWLIGYYWCGILFILSVGSIPRTVRCVHRATDSIMELEVETQKSLTISILLNSFLGCVQFSYTRNVHFPPRIHSKTLERNFNRAFAFFFILSFWICIFTYFIFLYSRIILCIISNFSYFLLTYLMVICVHATN